MSKDCLFCKIANHDIKVEVIFENEQATAVLDVSPIAPGHSLILPKVHAENILDLDDRYVEGVFIVVKRVVAILKEVFDPAGFTIGINHGEASGQTVPHLHIHVIPRFEGDGGKSLHSVVHNIPTENVGALAQRIRNSI